MARSFSTGTTATMSTSKMISNFQNTLKKVDNMIASNNIYSVWIKLVIGRSGKLVFDTSSTNKDENLVISLNYEKNGAGEANEFTFKVAFDLFNYGQNTKTNVEQLDELIYQALNINSYDDAIDIFYCKFQYGYNVTGSEQIVSPLYEGLITDIVPSVDYTNGKTYYTITGTSMIPGSSLQYSFDAVNDKNGLEVVAETLWYYCGNQAGFSSLSNFSNCKSGTQHKDVTENSSVTLFNIDIPNDLVKSASNVTLEETNKMTVIEYITTVLGNTYNTSDTRYNKETNNYDIEEGEFKPYYTYYITDSGGSGVPTIHIVYVSSNNDITKLDSTTTINFRFNWFTKSNNLVISWNPEVDLKTYFLTRAQLEKFKSEKVEIEQKIEENDKVIEDSTEDIWIDMPIQGPTQDGSALTTKYKLGTRKSYSTDEVESENAALKAQLAEIQDKLDNYAQCYEYYKASITLVGIPSDIPLGVLLNIVPIILESPSRTRGKYFILGSTDIISTNGLFTTKINLFRLKD